MLPAVSFFWGVDDFGGLKLKEGVLGGVLGPLQLSSKRAKLLCEDKESNESNRVELKFGKPQLQHNQVILELANASKTLEFIPKQFLWVHMLQESQAMASWFQRHGLEHTPQGYLGVEERGPGLSSTSPDNIIRTTDHKFLCLKKLTFRISLFLTFSVVSWKKYALFSLVSKKLTWFRL